MLVLHIMDGVHVFRRRLTAVVVGFVPFGSSDFCFLVHVFYFAFLEFFDPIRFYFRCFWAIFWFLSWIVLISFMEFRLLLFAPFAHLQELVRTRVFFLDVLLYSLLVLLLHFLHGFEVLFPFLAVDRAGIGNNYFLGIAAH